MQTAQALPMAVVVHRLSSILKGRAVMAIRVAVKPVQTAQFRHIPSRLRHKTYLNTVSNKLSVHQTATAMRMARVMAVMARRMARVMAVMVAVAVTVTTMIVIVALTTIMVPLVLPTRLPNRWTRSLESRRF